MTFYIAKNNNYYSINNVHENEINPGFSYWNFGLYVNSLEQFNCKYENVLADANRVLEINPTSARQKVAFKCFKKSAEIDNANGINNVGYYNCNVIGIKKDQKKAFEYIKKSAEMGNPQGINHVGYCNAIGIIIIGDCYFEGIEIKKDEKNTFRYFKKSADIVEKVKKKVFDYFKKSAEMSNDNEISNVEYCYYEGIENIGYCYNEGIRVVKDREKAFKYYKKSLGMGNALGIKNVKDRYFKGIGVKRRKESI
ncbi:hypothetical protein C2G38_2196386 [Gigaspora rosea]|uniref:HCP-like protein n=1 Tax=Gigaspora rosea TaxID=44941 RepID=A0A397UX79_9GLOM|nr:hypothetical protein C2G38_2196386 [Gigaspora rosea]